MAFLGVLVYKFYGEELREMFGYDEHPYGFYTMAGTAFSLSLSLSISLSLFDTDSHKGIQAHTYGHFPSFFNPSLDL